MKMFKFFHYLSIFIYICFFILEIVNCKINVHKSDALTWCSYVHFTPEPEFIVYNSIPNTGDYEFNSLIDASKKNNKYFDIIHVNHTHGYWYVDMDTHREKGLELISLIQKEITKYKDLKEEETLQYIIEGQWYFHRMHDNLNSHLASVKKRDDEIKPSNVNTKLYDGAEHIQLVRSCYDHIREAIISIILEEFRTFSNNDETLFLRSQLPNPFTSWSGCNVTQSDNCFDSTIVSLTIDECLSNILCFTNLNCIVEGLELRNIPKYFCGPSCTHRISHANSRFAPSDVNSTLAGAMERIYMRKKRSLVHQSVRYTVIGTYEQFPEYLKMLECVYPGAFQNLSLFSEFNARYLVDSSAYSQHYTTAIDNFASEYCDATGSNRLYADIQHIFQARIQLMQLKKDACCRARW